MKKRQYNFIDRTGEIHYTNQGYKITIIKYYNGAHCTIRFENGLVLEKVTYQNIRKKTIENTYHPRVFGIGYSGVGKFSCKQNKNYYDVWRGILKRAYCAEYHKTHPTYRTVTVCEEWHNFQNFAEWFEEKYNPEYMQDWHVDKDILVKGNKIYAPQYCDLVPVQINNIFVQANRSINNLPTGVINHGKRFKVRIRLGGDQIILNEVFQNVEDASEAYKCKKKEHVIFIAKVYKNKISTRIYDTLINYKF